MIGVDEREPHGTTIYNTTLYFGPDGTLLGKHRKLMPTGSERTVWGMGDGSTLPVIDTPYGRLSGLTCWENYMPLTRFYLYSQGVDIWTAPTLASGDGWIATMQHIAREGRCYVVGVNPCMHLDQIPADFPHRDRVRRRRSGRVGRARQQRHRRPRRCRPGRTGTARGDHPVRRHRPHRRAGRAPVLRPGRPLPPPRHLPAPRRHPAPPFGCPPRALRRQIRTSDGSTAAPPMPASRARMMAPDRSATCSLAMMLETWLRTVLLLTPRRWATAALSRPFGQQPQHLVLALGELRERRRRSRPAEVAEHLSGDPGAEERLAASDCADRGDDLVRP